MISTGRLGTGVPGMATNASETQERDNNMSKKVGELRDTARLYNQSAMTGMVNGRLVVQLVSSTVEAMNAATSRSGDVNSAISRALTHALLFALNNDEQKADAVYSALKRWTTKASIPISQSRIQESGVTE